jgi:hypothetical protein
MARRVGTRILIAVAVIVLAVAGILVWCKLYRVTAQPAWIAAKPRDEYLYGSFEARQVDGIPYWVWLALPRMFPEYTPGPGGYAAFGLYWEDASKRGGIEMPAGFAKQRIGYIRVTGNCAICHALSQPGDPAPILIPSVPGRTTDIQPLLTFYRRCAGDPRFTADDILAEVDKATKLSFTDRLLYRYVLIPRTRKALRDPAATLFAPAIREHLRDPKAHVPSAPLFK